MFVSFRLNLLSTLASQHHHLFTGYFQTSLCRLFWVHCILCFWMLSPFKGTPWRRTRRSLQLKDVFKGADKLMAVCAFANLSFIRALRIFWAKHGLRAIVLASLFKNFSSSARFRRARTSRDHARRKIRQRSNLFLSWCDQLSISSRLFCCHHHLIYQTVAHNNNTILTLTRRVPGILNAHVELHPVAVVGGGADQGGGHHCHRVWRPGDLRVVDCWQTTYPTKLIGKAQPW